MKTLLVLALVLTGCTTAAWRDFGSGFVAGGAAAQEQQQRREETHQQKSNTKNTDYKCLDNCTSSGYARGLCESKCSY